MAVNEKVRLLAPVLTLMMVLVGPPLIAGSELPAFPGAEGFGTTTPGGRGGQVLLVTNLDDAGPGSLRAACEAKGPRIVVFRVGGTITLDSDIDLTSPYCTIAGQTAPGGGVCVRQAGLNIATHDVVVRHVRFRMGRLPGEKVPHFRDNIDIIGTPPCHHVVLDHCSISWSVSRNLVTWNDAHDITVQWCIISEGFRDDVPQPKAYDGMGFLVGDRTKRFSIHHNLFAHNYQRNPRLKHGVHADIVNNVIYNWNDGGAHLIGDFKREPDAPAVHANILNNWYQAGPDTAATTPVIQALTSAELYVAGNVSNHRWYVEDLAGALHPITMRAERFPAPPVTTLTAKEAFARVLAGAGATRPRRDTVDVRIVDDVRSGTGGLISSEEEVGGWPDLERGTPRIDSDQDGMPDDWESRHGLDPADPRDASGDGDGSGYTHVEEYIHSLAHDARSPAKGEGQEKPKEATR